MIAFLIALAVLLVYGGLIVAVLHRFTLPEHTDPVPTPAVVATRLTSDSDHRGLV